ncbi:hypothetical protein ACFWIA_03825 [Streptomyces sp. NPDC127068]|uniref:hypothetical protein n=1 Tax=Streptomyces sp. NPDC127068 TaxID=3347127 RepID=UPI0036677E48
MNPATPEEPAVGAVVFDPTKGAVGRVIGLHHDLAMLQRAAGRPWEARVGALRPASPLEERRLAALVRRHASAMRAGR